jgi:hypothetical protein
VRRAHEARVGLAGQVDVVAVAARADEEARVLLAEDRLAESFAGRAGSRLEEGHARARSGGRAELDPVHDRPAGCGRAGWAPKRVSPGRGGRLTVLWP